MVSEKIDGMVVVDVNGVGYGVLVANEEYSELSVNDKTKLYIYEHIREQAYDLYGFLTLGSKALFEQLLDVNGVGPKMALNVLSIGSSNDVRQAIAGGNVKFIQQANGVGKKVAERIVVDLKDKVGLVGVDLGSAGLLQSDSGLTGDEAAEALIALGYAPADAAKALHGIDTDLSTEDRIKKALKG
jgi:Holliday junction DNA helicase RuvA